VPRKTVSGPKDFEAGVESGDVLRPRRVNDPRVLRKQHLHTEMPMLLPMMRMRLKIAVPLAHRRRAQRGERHRAQRHADQAKPKASSAGGFSRQSFHGAAHCMGARKALNY
jgi:hypothetical protein